MDQDVRRQTLDGWEANDNPASWTAKDGMIVGDGDRSHLFYKKEICENCEFKAEVRLNHAGNSGMYFRAEFVPGWPKGYEAQVDNTHADPVRTGSLYNFVKVFDQLVPDDTWWTQEITAVGNHIVIKVNGKVTVDYVDEKRSFMKGYLALQQHNKGSVVEYKNLMMRQALHSSEELLKQTTFHSTTHEFVDCRLEIIVGGFEFVPTPVEELVCPED